VPRDIAYHLEALAMDFVAFDFETANSNRNSACALGIAVIEEGSVTETREWQFRPRSSRFNLNNVRMHGITEASLVNCSDLSEVWHVILPYFQNRMVVAHYAAFDISVLRHSLDSYGIEYPDVEYSCSWQIAKATWSMFRCYSLPYLAARLKLPMRHHDAMSDAKTCAAIVLSACKKWNASTLEQLESCTKISRGQVSAQGHVPVCRSVATMSDQFGGK